MTLTLQGVTFDPRGRKISFSGVLPVDVLYDITREAFQHSNLIGWEMPVREMELNDGRTYYLIYWEVDGKVETSSHGGVEHIPVKAGFLV